MNRRPAAVHARPCRSASPPGRRGARRILRGGLALGLFALLSGAGFVHGATFTASLDRDTVQLGEAVVLQLTFEGGEPDAVPRLPNLPGLGIAYRGQNTAVAFVNGVVSRTLSHNFTVVPNQVGAFTIPALTATVAGQRVVSQPLKLTVVKAGTQPNAQLQQAFVRLLVPKTNIVVGEVIPLEIQIYWLNARDIQIGPLGADGFTVIKELQPTQTRTRVGNLIYNVAVVRKSLVAAKAGALALGPAEVGMNLVVQRQSPRTRDPFGMDPFDAFDSFFNRGELVPVQVRSDPLTLHVAPIPRQNAPPHFTGAVGTYSLAVLANPTNVAVGEPISVKVQIAGRGALDALAFTPFDQARDFKSYPPTSSVELTDELGLEGTKTFEQVVVPQHTEVRALPALHFSFFDPDQKAFRTLTHPATPIVVRPTVAASPPLSARPTAAEGRGPNASSAANVSPELVALKARVGTLATVQPPLLRQPWFLLLQGVPLLLWLSSLVWRKHRDHLASHPRLVRRQQVLRLVRHGLAELARLAQAGRSEEFFATAFRLLQEQLGERLDLPAGAITEAVLDEQLRPRGAPEELLAALHDLFQNCNQARYAPTGSRQSLDLLRHEVQRVLRELQTLEFQPDPR